MASRAPLLASIVAMTSCLGPNPYLDGDDDVDDESESSDDATDDDTTLETTNDTETNTDSSDDMTSGGPSCENEMLDPNETAIDCGGDCDPCEDGLDCLVAEDCLSGVCDDTCQAPACDDEVLNGDELEADCGGSACGFCELSIFIPAWDDIDGRDAALPTVDISDDGEVALGFTGSNEARLRWFEANGAPLSSSALVGELIMFANGVSMPLVLRADESDPAVVALIAGLDMISTNEDLFMVTHSLADGEGETRTVYQGPLFVVQGAVASVSTQAVFAWKQDKQIYLRRRDFSITDSEWIDLMAFQAETMPMQYDGDRPDLAVDADGTIVLAWSRCDKVGTPCSIAVRRFEGDDWLDAEPVVVSPTNVYLTAPHVAIDADGRIGLSWSSVDIDGSWGYARILDADLVPEGDPWVLQMDLPMQVDTDVAALDDGTFAFVWADTGQNRVHLRRFVGNDMPKLMNVGDEAPWPNTDQPAAPALANANHQLAVVWSADDGSFRQIHGQVLAY